MKSLRLRWDHKNRTWIFCADELKDEPLFYGFGNIITKLTREYGAVMARKSLREGCHLLIDTLYFPDAYRFEKSKEDIGGAWYENDKLGRAWIPCTNILGCKKMLYLNVEVR
tara:strand:+ start:176 stop:511 length:336 start_codon:yes stop_codon:yes gene_type:complete